MNRKRDIIVDIAFEKVENPARRVAKMMWVENPGFRSLKSKQFL